jgi:hypothetical protein
MKKGFAGPTNGITLFPERGGVTATLTGLDLTTEVAPGQIFQPAPLFVNNCKSCDNMKNITGKKRRRRNNTYGNIGGSYPIFDPYGGTIFSGNNSDYGNTGGSFPVSSTAYYGKMKNAEGDEYDYYNYTDDTTSGTNTSGGGGGFLSGLNLADLLKIGTTIYSNQQQIKLAEQQGKITAQQAAQARAQLAAAQEKTQQDLSVKDRIKAYGVPIAIGGAVIILGIAAYFFFKKKKIN